VTTFYETINLNLAENLPRCCNTEPGQGYFQSLAPAFAEAPALRKASGGGASRRQVQGFGKIPAALCGDFPAKPPSTPARFRYGFFTTDGKIYDEKRE